MNDNGNMPPNLGTSIDVEVQNDKSVEATAFPWVDTVISFLCISLAIYILIEVKGFKQISSQIETMGAGFIPSLIAYCLIIMGIWLLFSSVILKKPRTLKLDLGSNISRRILLLVIILVYKFVLPILTFIPSTLLMIAIASKICGERSIKNIALISSILTISIFFVFRNLLRIPLP